MLFENSTLNGIYLFLWLDVRYAHEILHMAMGKEELSFTLEETTRCGSWKQLCFSLMFHLQTIQVLILAYP